MDDDVRFRGLDTGKPFITVLLVISCMGSTVEVDEHHWTPVFAEQSCECVDAVYGFGYALLPIRLLGERELPLGIDHDESDVVAPYPFIEHIE